MGFLKEGAGATFLGRGENVSGSLGAGLTRQALGRPPLAACVRRTKLEWQVRERPCFPLSTALPSTSLKGMLWPSLGKPHLGCRRKGQD